MGIAEPILDRWQTLRRNPVTWIAAAAFTVTLFPYVFPVLSPGALEYFADWYADFPLILTAIVAFQYRRSRMARLTERRFWDLWTAAFVCWLIVRVFYAATPFEYILWWFDLVVDSLYLLFYLCIVLALELRPDRPARTSLSTMRRWIEAAGAAVFLCALLVYYAIIPGMLSPDAYWTWVPSLALYVTLDAVVLLTLLFVRHDCGSPTWRSIYGWLAVAAALWLVADGLEVLTYAEIVPLYRSGVRWDLIWYAPFVPVILAALLREHPFEAEPGVDTFVEGPEPRRGRGSVLVLYAVLLPTLHFTYYGIGLGDPESHGAREILLLVAAVILGGLVLSWQRLLQWENRRLEAERRLNEERRLETVRRLERERAEKELLSEQRTLEAQLQQAQKMEAVGQLSGGMAHDFNNILTVIMANADLVDAALPTECHGQRSDLQELREAARRGSAMVKRLLGFSRQALLSPRPVNLSELVDELLVTLRRLIPETITIEFTAEPLTQAVVADPGAVEQILINLATNARDAMPEGGTLTVGVRPAHLDERHRVIHGWGEPGDYLCLSVRDVGTGMSDETRGRVFEPFFTTKQPGEGTGLGMAMIYGLIKQHRGFVGVESAPGEGTTVRIYFPVAGELGTEVALDGTEGTLPRGTETILLVEDEAGIRRSAERALALFGYEVIVACDGDEGLQLFEEAEDEIGLVISDVVMPRMNGHELYEAVRQRSPATAFILISGYADRGRLQAGEIGAAIPLIAKPWALHELLQRVREALDGGGS